jgi:hypothetical protein
MSKIIDKKLTKEYFKKISSPRLAGFLAEFVWGMMMSGSRKSDLVEEVINRLKKDSVCISDVNYEGNLEWVAKSYRKAMKGELIPCRVCQKKFPLVKLFRCFHCGSYFCPKCGREHFGERVSRFEVAT